MEKIYISLKTLEKLKSISVFHPRVSKYLINGVPHIIKKLDGSRTYNDNVIYTIEELDNNSDILPQEFCIPDYLVETEEGIRAFATPEILNSLGLDIVLSSPDFTHKEKINYLKEFGTLLRNCDELRKVKKMRSFAIGDIQEENILVEPKTKKIHVIDMDTCRICNGCSSQAKFLTPYSLASNVPRKYRVRGNFCYIETSKESDLFCYIIMILNYLAGENISNINLNDFYSYLDRLDYIGINPELLSIFYGIVQNKENKNPDYLLESIDEKILSKSRYFT